MALPFGMRIFRRMLRIRCRLQGVALAGKPFNGVLAPGQAIRIMTGAPLPDELDTVVPQELCDVHESTVLIPGGQIVGQHCRAAGEDIAAGSLVLAAGRILSAADVGLAASLGLSGLQVWRKPRIAVFSTGDELLAQGQPLAAGKIYDSNRFILLSLLRDLGLDAEDLGIVPDRPRSARADLAIRIPIGSHHFDGRRFGWRR